jgi:hypothetical protein
MRNPGIPEANHSGESGCLWTTAFLASALLALGDLLWLTFTLTGPTSFGLNGILAALLTLTAFLSVFAASVATLIGRYVADVTAPGALAIRLLGVIVVAAVVAGSVWYALGDPATGTLTEVPVLALGPPLAGLLALAIAPRAARSVALAFLVLGLVTAALIVITVAHSGTDESAIRRWLHVVAG